MMQEDFTDGVAASAQYKATATALGIGGGAGVSFHIYDTQFFTELTVMHLECESRIARQLDRRSDGARGALLVRRIARAPGALLANGWPSLNAQPTEP